MALLVYTGLHYTVPHICLAVLTLYHISGWIYWNALHLYYTVPWLHSALLDVPLSTMALLGSTPLYHGSTWLYLTLLHPTMALLGSA